MHRRVFRIEKRARLVILELYVDLYGIVVVQKGELLLLKDNRRKIDGSSVTNVTVSQSYSAI